MKTFTILLTAYCTVIVEAENIDEAGLIAMSETPIYSFNIESGDQISEVPSDEIERAKRHADHVILSGSDS